MQTPFYVTSAQIEALAEKHYQRYGSKITFAEALQSLYLSNEYFTLKPRLYDECEWHLLSDSEFNRILIDLPVTNPFAHNLPSKYLITAEGIIPDERDVYAIRYIKNIARQIHVHNYFEINYVLSGSCTQIFESEKRHLSEGEMCIIAPMSKHDLEVDDDSMILNIILRESTFENTFFRLLSQEDLLATFFRNVLYSKDSAANYLLFQTDNSSAIKDALKDIFMEIYKEDEYSNTCVISRIHLLFSILLRKYEKTIQFYDYQKNCSYHVDFPLVLRYIQKNYTHLTLQSLAEFFHYSESYLSRLIKNNSGRSFTSIITSLRMEKAEQLLTNTEMSVKTITTTVGYDSVDHFSRTFKKYFGQAPQQYRIANR